MSEGATPPVGAAGRERVGVILKATYGSGQLAEGVTAYVIGNFLVFYYTAILGLPASLAGAATATSLIADALIDPIIGSWSDNFRSPMGRRIPFMFVGGPMLAIGLALVFTPPAGLPILGLFAWLAIGSVLLRFSLSTFQLPFIALGAELSNDYTERSSIAAFRLIYSIVGPVAVIVLAYQVFLSGHEGLRHAAGYAPLGWSAAAIALAGTMLSVLGSRGRAARLRATPVDAAALYRRLGREVVEIFKNPSFRLLFLCGVTFYTAQGVSVNLNQDLNLFVWKLAPKQIQTVALSEFAGLLVGLPIAPLLSRWLEKRSVVIFGVLFVVLGQGVLKGLRGLELFTLTGQAAVPALAAANFLVGLGVAFAAISIFSMMGDAADEHDFLFASRREGLYFAGLTFAAKTATGLGALIAGLALDAISFPRGAAAAHASAAAIAPTVLDNLCLVAGPAVAVGGFVAMTLMAFYRINRHRHAEVVAALNARDQRPE